MPALVGIATGRAADEMAGWSEAERKQRVLAQLVKCGTAVYYTAAVLSAHGAITPMPGLQVLGRT